MAAAPTSGVKRPASISMIMWASNSARAGGKSTARFGGQRTKVRLCPSRTPRRDLKYPGYCRLLALLARKRRANSWIGAPKGPAITGYPEALWGTVGAMKLLDCRRRQSFPLENPVRDTVRNRLKSAGTWPENSRILSAANRVSRNVHIIKIAGVCCGMPRKG